MKPLARWTIGCVNSNGEETLRRSVRSFRRLYPEFDCIVCHNHLKRGQFDRLQRLNIPLYEQSEGDTPCALCPVTAGLAEDYSMPGWGWKLAPPRLRPGAYELWIDNDIVFHDRLPSLDRWLREDQAIISSAWKPMYGRYETPLVNTPVCAGFFGIPPTTNFVREVEDKVLQLKGDLLGYWDEQGLVVSIVSSMPHLIVPMDEMLAVKVLAKPFPPALHFIGVNRTQEHYSWNQYQCSITLM